MSSPIKPPRSLESNNTMRREESPLDFLDSVSKLSSTPLEYLPGYKMLPGYVPPTYSGILDDEPEPEPTYTLEQERELLDTDPHNFVRSKIKEQVQDVVWLDKLKQNLVDMEEKKKTFASDRCIVCTLPYGTCMHTREFIAEKNPTYKEDKTKDEIDREMDDMMAVIGGSVEVDTFAEATTDIDIETMKWEKMQAESSDKIGEVRYSLATPSMRGWHTTVYMEKANVIVLFGGLRYKNREAPQPFGAVPAKGDVEYLCDLYIYAVMDKSWHCVKYHADGPGGRYGHVAAALDERRMMINGGRGGNGQFLNDTWIYDIVDDSWIAVDMSVDSPAPSPRVWAGCAAVHHVSDVYLFGGTDGVDNFGDLWVFHGGDLTSRTDTTSASAMRWERVLAVGIPPSPRYGHQLVILHEPSRMEFEEKEPPPRLAVMGGCTVSPQSEITGTDLTPEEHKHMLDLGFQLERRYRREGDVAELGGQSLMASVENAHSLFGTPSQTNPKDLYYQAATVTGNIADLEFETRAAERELVEAYNLTNASRTLKSKKAKHPNPHADIYFLDIRDLTWRHQIYPKLTGEIPPSRMHFGAFSTCDFLLVAGGARPTSLGHVCVDNDHHRIYALDLRRMVWFQAAPRSSSEYLELPISIAGADVTRAKGKVQLERDRGKSLGAKNGMTVELAEAEAVEKVCQWRLQQLQHDAENMVAPPSPRWGATTVVCRSRGFVIGGWHNKLAVPNTDSYILDLEQEHERRRREDDEFAKRLESQRRNEEARSASADMQSAYELKQLIAAESDNALKERHLMGIEDILSCVPPLTRMSKPECVKVNATTVWLEWELLTQDSRELPIDPSTVTYRVWMVPGYTHYAVEDRVLVMPAAAQEAIEQEMLQKLRGDDDDMSILTASTALTAQKPKFNFGSNVSLGSSTAKGSSAITEIKKKGDDMSGYRGRGFPGEIIRCHVNTGLFDVAFDDGQVELNIHRKRMKLERERWDDSDDEDFDILEQKEPPAGTSYAAWNAMRAEKAKIKAQNSKLTMLNKHAYTIREDMSIAAKRRINRKLGIRDRKLAALKRFSTPAEVLKAQEEEAARLERKKKKKKNQFEESDDDTASVAGNKKRSSRKGSKADSFAAGNPERKEDGGEEEEEEEEFSSDEDSDSDEDTVDPEQGFDRHKFMKKLSARASSSDPHKQRVTVDVDKPWELVFEGNVNQCEVSGLVPWKVLQHHPDYYVNVKFAIQAIGVDFPSYEHSELSEVLEVMTKPNPDPAGHAAAMAMMANDGGDVSPLATPRGEESKKVKELMDAINAGSKFKTGEEAYTLEGEGTGEYYM
jgi:hypothetical protein